jgi:hypothetical protein
MMEIKEKLWRHFAVALIMAQGLYMIPVFLTHIGVDVLYVLEEMNPYGVYWIGWPFSWIVGASELCVFYGLIALTCYVLHCKLRIPVFKGWYLIFYFSLAPIIADAVWDICAAFSVVDTCPEMAFVVAQVFLWLIVANLTLMYLLERKRTKHRPTGLA